MTVLSRAELEGLTGYRQPRKMAAWLTQNHWVFAAGGGRTPVPRVDRDYYLAKMSGTLPAAVRVGPDMSFMRKR